MSFGLPHKKPISKSRNEERIRSRAYTKCTICNKVFYCDKININTRGKKCKCGNVWVGIHKIADDGISKYRFFVAIKYTDERPEFGDKKVKPKKKD